jgi:hydrogenase/urease accessory protein HupE
MKRALCAWVVAAATTAAPAFAHPVPFTYLDLRVQPTTIEGTLVAHVFDIGHDLNIDPPDRLLDPAVASQQASAISRLLLPRLVVAADGRTLAPEASSQVDVLADRQSLRLHITYALAGPPATIDVTAALFPYDPFHRTFLNVYETVDDKDVLTQAILDRGRDPFEYFTGTRQGAMAVAERFVPAGIRHILIGPDHLIFLLGLLLLGGPMRQFALIVTAFTLAHSLTLSLAALDIVSPPTRLVEPAIALSIVYLGADNLLIRGGRDVRFWIASAFGLIHGFGYASVLRGLNLPARALGWSLVSFNVGVEIGQSLLVVVVASALAALRSRSDVLGRRLAFVGSVVVMAAGAFWFIQRVFFPGGFS